MEGDFTRRWSTIVITSPDYLPDEAQRITQLLTSGAADEVHIRKPAGSARQIASLLAEIPRGLHSRLHLHDHHELSAYFPEVSGVHLNNRNPLPPAGKSGRITTGFHTLAELKDASDYEYVTLSPIYNSISKPGYEAAFFQAELTEALVRHDNVIALGGVKPEYFRELSRMGFRGAALLGYVWSDFKSALPQLIKHRALINHFPLQFITNGSDVSSTVSQASAALKGGCRWIQIRMKESSSSEQEMAILAILNECRAVGATLIIDDNVELAARYGIGVHLGKADMPPRQARHILGPGAIIGSTCNNADDLCRVVAEGASDYIGLGPFRFTRTKKNLAPVLGVEGYNTLLATSCLKLSPVVAIGGITAADLPQIFSTGISGIAVSGEITASSNPTETTAQLVRNINNTI